MTNHSKPVNGQAMILSMVFLAVILIISAALFARVAGFIRFGSRSILQEQAVNLAEAGVDFTIWQLNETAGSFSGKNDVAPGQIGTFSVTIEDNTATTKTITSTGYVPNATSPRSKKTVKVKAVVTTTSVSFRYGVQVGSLGLTMENNSQITGNVYSNGPIKGDTQGTKPTITGDAFSAAASSSTTDQQNSIQTADFTFADNNSREDAAQSFKPAITSPLNKVSLYIKKVGNPQDADVIIVADNAGKPDKNSLATAKLKASKVTATYGWVEVAGFDKNPQLTAGTTYWLVIDAGSTSSSKYWIWGASSDSAYIDGKGMYSPNFSAKNPIWSNANYDFNFKLFLGAGVNKITNLNVGGNASANTIENSTIGGTAYCQTGTGNNQPCDTSQGDPSPQDLPISQANIDQWKQDAQAGGITTGNFNPTAGAVTLGPQKITGDLILDDIGQTLTVTGTIWVQGNIDIKNNANIKLDPSFGDASGVILTDGWIHIDNNGQFQGSGQANSYILLLSTNNCIGIPQAGCTHHDGAIDLHNNVTSAIVYASEGLLHLHNGVAIKEAVAQKLQLEQGANVTYDSGLANIQFSSGPGASWQIKRGTYKFTTSP